MKQSCNPIHPSYNEKKFSLFIVHCSLFILLMFFAGCIQNEAEMESGVIGAKEPEFEGPTQIEDVTASSIRVSATVSKENGYKITERGFFVGTSETPSEENGAMKIVDTNMDVEKRIGSYALTINNLNNNTTYYVRPYAINTIGTGFGSETNRITNVGIAGIITVKPDIVRASSAKTGVVITYSGEGEILKTGIYFYEKGHSEKTDSIIYQTSYPFTAKQGDTLICQLSGLKPETAYDVRAFLVNTYGITLGDEYSFQTLDGKPEIVSQALEERKYTEVTLSATVTDGGDETVRITERGFCWAIATVTTIPDISNDTVRCANGTGYFKGTITGLTSNIQYFARAYAISDLGITVYGDEAISVRTIMDIPTVITEEVSNSNMEGGTAVVKGIIDNEGESPVYDSGICWSRTQNEPTIADSVLHLVAGADSVFSGLLTGLRGGITYYVRAFATNSKGTAYGDVKTFQTPPIFTTGLQPFGSSMRIANSMAYFAIGQYLYLLGGDLGPSCTNELWRYSIASNNWDPLLAFAGGPAKWQFGVTYGNGAYVYGGYNSNGNETSGLYYYDPPPQNRWYYYDGPDSTVIHSTIGFAFRNYIYYVGGQSGDTVRQDVWRFDHPYHIWDKMADFPVKQYGGVSVVIDTVPYVGLGRDENDVCNGTLWTTSDGALTWDLKNTYHFDGYVAGGVVCHGRLYVVDINSSTNHDILEYNPETDEWKKKTSFPEGHKAYHCMYVVNNKIYIGLGGGSLMVYDPLWDNE